MVEANDVVAKMASRHSLKVVANKEAWTNIDKFYLKTAVVDQLLNEPDSDRSRCLMKLKGY